MASRFAIWIGLGSADDGGAGWYNAEKVLGFWLEEEGMTSYVWKEVVWGVVDAFRCCGSWGFLVWAACLYHRQQLRILARKESSVLAFGAM